MSGWRPMQASPGQRLPPPMWFPDPWVSGQWRWFDGTQWTHITASMSPSSVSPDDTFATQAVTRSASSVSARRAGQSAAERAEALKTAAPFRTGLARVLGVHTDERAWRLGAKGERMTARKLAELPSPPWTVLHDLPLGSNGANLDHLVVGPPGVFALNTKYLNAKVWVGERAVLVNGQRTEFLSKSRAEGRRVAATLQRAVGHPVAVTPLLVVICDRLTVKAQPADVQVLRRVDLLRWLERRSVSIAATEVRSLGAAAARSATWL